MALGGNKEPLCDVKQFRGTRAERRVLREAAAPRRRVLRLGRRDLLRLRYARRLGITSRGLVGARGAGGVL